MDGWIVLMFIYIYVVLCVCVSVHLAWKDILKNICQYTQFLCIERQRTKMTAKAKANFATSQKCWLLHQTECISNTVSRRETGSCSLSVPYGVRVSFLHHKDNSIIKPGNDSFIWIRAVRLNLNWEKHNADEEALVSTLSAAGKSRSL